MTVIAVDIDDTLYSFGDLARSVFVDVALERCDKRLQRGAYCAWGEWRSPADVTDDDVWGEVIDLCHSSENIQAQRPYPEAVAVLTELAEQGYQLRYVSNRKQESWQATYNWLTAHDFPLWSGTELSCIGQSSKLKAIRDAQYLIDDRPRTLVEFVYDFHWKYRNGSENGVMARKAFGLYTPYNAALTDVPGVKLAPNWKLLRQYLIEQNVLVPQVLQVVPIH